MKAISGCRNNKPAKECPPGNAYILSIKNVIESDLLLRFQIY